VTATTTSAGINNFAMGSSVIYQAAAWPDPGTIRFPYLIQGDSYGQDNEEIVFPRDG
jgi:hypothetical protein